MFPACLKIPYLTARTANKFHFSLLITNNVPRVLSFRIPKPVI